MPRDPASTRPQSSGTTHGGWCVLSSLPLRVRARIMVRAPHRSDSVVRGARCHRAARRLATLKNRRVARGPQRNGHGSRENLGREQDRAHAPGHQGVRDRATDGLDRDEPGRPHRSTAARCDRPTTTARRDRPRPATRTHSAADSRRATHPYAAAAAPSTAAEAVDIAMPAMCPAVRTVAGRSGIAAMPSAADIAAIIQVMTAAMIACCRQATRAPHRTA